MSIGIHLSQDVNEALEVGTSSYGEAMRKLVSEHSSRCGQIFIMQPRGHELMNFVPGDLTVANFHVYAHASYTSHMLNAPGRAVIHLQMKQAAKLKIHGLIVHLENGPLEANVEAAAELLAYGAELKRSYDLTAPPLIFEINAVSPKNAIFSDPTQLRAFVRALSQRGFKWSDFGICIDTAHLWSCGTSVRTGAEMHDWLRELQLDTRWIKLFHLNDSAVALGGADKHAIVGRGHIWLTRTDEGHFTYNYKGISRYPRVTRASEPGFMEVIRFAKTHKIDIILERSSAEPEDILGELNGLIDLSKHMRHTVGGAETGAWSDLGIEALATPEAYFS